MNESSISGLASCANARHELRASCAPVGNPVRRRFDYALLMMSRRINRRGLSGWLIVAVLFMQIATFAYACPMSRVQADGSQELMAGMPCAAMMSAGATLDVDQPGLCQQHCQQGTTQQPADSSPLAQVPPLALVPLFTVSPAVVVDTAPSQWAAHERRRDHAPPPAHSILHCCYRI